MKNKTIFKILSIIMILALIIGSINISSYATTVTSSSTSTITISGLEAGVTSTAYQIATVNIDASGVISDPMYSWVDSVQSYVEGHSSTSVSKYADISTFAELDEEEDAQKIADFYSIIASAIETEDLVISKTYTTTTSGTQTYPVTDENLNSTATFENVEMGLYLIITENGYRVYYPSVVSVTPEYSETSEEWTLNEDGYEAEVKSSSPTITKTITDEEKEEDSYGISEDAIQYTIIADVPSYTAAQHSCIYTISDTLPDGFALDEDSLVITGYFMGDEAWYTLDQENFFNEDYLVYSTDSEGSWISGINIEINSDSIYEFETIIVVYTAYIRDYDSITIGPDGNTNVATLTYSNNPYDESSTGQVISTGATLYTYGIEITNVDSDDTSTTLAGATFNLYSSDGSTLLYFVKSSDGVYYLTTSDNEDAVTDISTDNNGNLYIYGLDEGTYYLQETVAPDGYVLDSSQTEITLTDADSDGDLDGILDSNDNDEDGVYELTFTNSDGFSLPVTGGIGTTIFIIAGVCLIILGLALKISKKGKNTTK